MFDLSEFQIETVTIEVRYDKCFAIWDNAGAIWTELQSSFPDLQLQTANPWQQIFESDRARAIVELEVFRVVCRGPEAEALAAGMAQKMLGVCSTSLNLALFKRIGYREIRTKSYASKEEGFSAISYLIPATLTGTLLNESKAMTAGFTLRQESKTFGLNGSVRTEERETKLTIPWEVRQKVSSELPTENLIVIDSDYYTLGTTRRDGLSLEELAKQASRVINRYWKSVLG